MAREAQRHQPSRTRHSLYERWWRISAPDHHEVETQTTFVGGIYEEERPTMKATHDVRDRRHTNMQRVMDALDALAVDADAIGDGSLPAGLSYSVADRARRLRNELAAFKARDLLNQREVTQ